MRRINTDIIIVGIGSAGFGALYNALKHGEGKYKVVAIDKNPGMGGTSTFGGVNNWEPGVGGPGIHTQLAETLIMKKTACVGKSNNSLTERIRWGSSVPCDDPYEMTLSRTNALSGTVGSDGVRRGMVRRLHFEPEAMDMLMQKLVEQFKNFEIYYNTEFVSSKCSNGKIKSVTLKNNTNGEVFEIFPKLVMDCSADIVVARSSGCKTAIGEENHYVYNEPSAPGIGSDTVNAITQMFFVSPCDEDYLQEIPDAYSDVDVSEWLEIVRKTNSPVSCFYYYDNGDISVNMLPTMEGKEYLSLGEEKAKKICMARAYHYWRWIQEEKGFKGYKIKSFSPMMGVRETYRLVGSYVLKEQDVRAGLLQQPHKDELIAFCDHALDTHSKTTVKGKRCAELDKPYGIPYSCLLTNEISNMLVACRGASFSHIAASSARLTRSMLAMGEAAGAAAVMCLQTGNEPSGIDVQELRERLKIPEFEAQIVEKWKLGI